MPDEHTPRIVDSDAERAFYLREFRGKSLLFAVRAADLTAPAPHLEVVRVLEALASNDTRSIVVVETSESPAERHAVDTLYGHLRAKLPDLPAPAFLLQPPDADESCLRIWETLRATPVFIGLWPASRRGSVLPAALGLAIRLKVYKLVLLDRRGGFTVDGAALSFVNRPLSADTRSRMVRGRTPDDRSRQIATAQRALAAGVASVSVCAPAALAAELFTYEGCGTLFTPTDYCRVERLAVDDFPEAERLLHRGEHAGYLRERSPAEVSRLLLHGYGARLGTEREIVGLCALLPFSDDAAAEIAGLYTRLRFHGGGIGSRLVLKALDEARTRGLAYVFACTNQAVAGRLFERLEFRRVTERDVPSSKWRSYPPDRKHGLRVYRCETA